MWCQNRKKVSQTKPEIEDDFDSCFLGYRNALPLEVYARRVVIPRNGKRVGPTKKISENPFETFRSYETIDIRKEQKKHGDFKPEDQLHVYMVIKTRINKLKSTDIGKLKNTIESLDESNMNKSTIPGTKDVEKCRIGPFAEPPMQTGKALNDVLGEDYSYCWSEWWLHLYLKNRITINLRDLKTIIVDTNIFIGYLDMSAKHCTIQQSMALAHNFEIIEEKKEIVNYNGSKCISTGYFYENVFIKAHKLQGRAKWRVVPDDSQLVIAVVGRSITRFPLVYWDTGREIDQEEFNHLLREHPESTYPILENLKEFKTSDDEEGLASSTK